MLTSLAVAGLLSLSAFAPGVVCVDGVPVPVPVDEELREEVAGIYQFWIEGLAEALGRGQEAGNVRRDVEAFKVARFVVAAVEGSIGMAKSARCGGVLGDSYEMLDRFLVVD